MGADYIKGGGMSLHAPSVLSMGKDAFIAFYMDRVTFIEDRTKRIKYLTSKYEQCESLMNPVKYKGVAIEAEQVEKKQQPVKRADAPVNRNSKSKKHTEKKE